MESKSSLKFGEEILNNEIKELEILLPIPFPPLN
jgi:hypothetical protein